MESKKSWNFPVVFFYSVLVLLGFLVFPYTRDFDNYRELCSATRDWAFYEALTHYDPIFTASCNLVGAAFPVDVSIILVGLSFTAICLYLKFSFFLHWKKAFWFICVFYVARFFILQGVTQIRAGLAVALLGIVFLMGSERRWLPTLLFSGMSVLVHLSSITVLPAVLIVCRARARLLKLIAYGAILLVVLLYCLMFFYPQAIDGAMLLDFQDVDPRFAYYLKEKEIIQVPFYLNFYANFKFVALLVFLFMAMFVKSSFENDMYRVSALVAGGFIIQLLLYNNEALSLRFSELFSIFDAVLIGVLACKLVTKSTAPVVFMLFSALSVLFFSRQLAVLAA